MIQCAAMSIEQRARVSIRPAERRSAEQSKIAESYLAFLIMALLFGAALLMYGYHLGFQPLWLDEGWTWSIVKRNGFWSLIQDLFRPSQSYPLFHLLLKPVILIFGNSEWALRLPSAIAGALAVPVIFALGRELRGWVLGLGAASLLLISHFAAWQAQDTKAYSLMLLAALLLALTLARALRRNLRQDWLIFGSMVIISFFVHRFLLFTLLGCLVAWMLTTRYYQRWVLLGAGLIGIGLVVAMVLAQDYFRAGVQFARVLPHRAAWRTFVQFSIGLWFRQVQPPWLIPLLLMPFGVLSVVGGTRLLWELLRGRNVRSAAVILALGGVPALLFTLLLILRPFYAPRYMTGMLPFWLLTVAWSFPESFEVRGRRLRSLWAIGGLGLWCWAMLASAQALFMPSAGLFSGSVVKEDYRGALRYLAAHVQPDDLLIFHPHYITPLYDYYAPRVTGQPLRQPHTYPQFAVDPDFEPGDFYAAFETDLQPHQRAWLLIAPAHASVHDPPQEGDALGVVGSAFQRGHRQWRPCDDVPAATFLEVEVYCLAKR
jgi:mannosyltransferase